LPAPHISDVAVVDLFVVSFSTGMTLSPSEKANQHVTGITTGKLLAPFRILGPTTRKDGKALKPDELALTAGWGHGGGGTPVMPSRGKITQRTGWLPEELAELTDAAKAANHSIDELVNRLGPPIDVWLNDVAYWRSVPTAVWEYSIGGYQVFTKWLSYREQNVLGRPLTLNEAREGTGIVRRLAAIVLLGPQLDANYKAISADPYALPEG
jgi:hypothetical protein